MPSFFSKKTRSQQPSSAGDAGESPSGPAVGVPPPPGPPPPPLPDDPYQLLHQQQQSLEEYADRRIEINCRPSEPFSARQFHGRRPHSPHSPYPAGVDLRYGREEQQQQQQQQQKQQQQQYRHPAHHTSNQPSLDRPTISVVTPSPQHQQQNLNGPPTYPPSPDLAGDSFDQQQWTTSIHNTSNPDLLDDQARGKLQKKKKKFFSRNQSVASSGGPDPEQSTKRGKSLGRSASIKHSFGREHTIQPPESSSSEYGKRTTPTSTSGYTLDHNRSQSTLDIASQQFESDASLRPPTAETPVSPNRLSQPHTPLENTQSSQRLEVGTNDRSHLGWQHRRSESAESLPSQISSFHASLNLSLSELSISDMSTAQQPIATRPTESQSQSQAPSRKDSMAAPSGQSHLQNASQTSSKQASQQNSQDTPGREPSHRTSLREKYEPLDRGGLINKLVEREYKYHNVKREYFKALTQITTLQNTVANQRMAVSRTVLDDNEYISRFQRLDGAIKELAFSVRKDWRAIPHWLHPFVNEDAVAVGTKEMTGVGRAVISRWIVEEVFNRYFHPGLERSFSERLKSIEMSLRRQQIQVFNEDDKENQVARISNWRRTTLDGLAEMLQSKTTPENQEQLVEYLVEKLSATLQCDLKEPAPMELAHYTRMIVTNAVNIAEKIPQEARDIVVDYIMPGTLVSETNMKVETGLPPLTRTIAEARDDNASEGNNDEMETDNKEQSMQQAPQTDQQGKGAATTAHLPQNREQRKKYPFGSLMSKKSSASQSHPPGTAAASPENTTSNSEQDEQLQQQQDRRSRVRLSTFMTVEVKGRGPNNVLVQAPVYT